MILLRHIFLFVLLFSLSFALSSEQTSDGGILFKKEGVFEAEFSSSGDLVSYLLFSRNWKRQVISKENSLLDESRDLSSVSGIRFGFISRKDPGFLFSLSSMQKLTDSFLVVFKAKLEDPSSLANGLEVIKTWRLEKDYFLTLQVELKNQSSKVIALWPSTDVTKSLGLVFGVRGEVEYWSEFIAGGHGNFAVQTLEKGFKQISVSDWNLLSFRNQFFLFALMDTGKHPLYASLEKVKHGPTDSVDKGVGIYSAFLPFSTEELLPGASQAAGFHFYLGPKLQDSLEGSLFSPLFNKYGKYLGPIERLMFWILDLFFRHTHSYGLSILLLTLVVKIFLIPLNIKQTRSMAKMQEIQPLMKKIQEDYAEDKQRMNQEMMKLYQNHQVNPFAGCLPMLLQLPIFLALFYTVGSSVEMYGEKFLWLPDLAAKDPYDVLPAIFVLSFVLSQKKMNIDPNQRFMMLFLPVLFFFMMRSLVSGVMLYIVGQSLFTNLEQMLIKKDSKQNPAAGKGMEVIAVKKEKKEKKNPSHHKSS